MPQKLIPNVSNTSLIIPEVIHQAPDWLVINKPSGWLTIPGRSHERADQLRPCINILIDWARNIDPQCRVVHRLDRETSGVVLFARSAEAHRLANTWFETRKMKKAYHCLAQGVPRSPLFQIKSPIQGASSTTQVEVKESFEEGFLAEVHPLTGRRHQIRIHLSLQGFPIWGDTEYGGATQVALTDSNPIEVSRVALHASSLRLPTGEEFRAVLPQDFTGWFQTLKERGTPCRF